MARLGTLYDPNSHELLARIVHGGISTSRDTAGQLFHRAEFYVLEEMRSLLPLLNGGVVWAQLTGDIEGLASIEDGLALPGRLIQGRLRSIGNWEAHPAPAAA